MSFIPESSSDPLGVALAVLDPGDLTVKWHNDKALELLPEPHCSTGIAGMRITDVIPVAKALGVASRLHEVVRTGVPFHITTHFVSAAQSGETVCGTAYLLHSGELLLVTSRR